METKSGKVFGDPYTSLLVLGYSRALRITKPTEPGSNNYNYCLGKIGHFILNECPNRKI